MLRKVDAMSMSNSLEVRVPFLDHELVNYLFQLPEHFKIKGKSRKHILKETFKDLLPTELYHRGKQGFDVPMLHWFRTELAEELNKTIFNRDLMESIGLFNWDEIERINKKLHARNPGDVHIQVWQLYVFVKWWSTHRFFKSQNLH
jgi:asparagine synthase (glutamine-hydrolysing)